MEDSIAGLVGTFTNVYAGLPFEVVKVRLQTQPTLNSSLQCIIQMFQKEGLKSFFKGASPALLSTGVENVAVFTANGLLYKWFANKNEKITFGKACLLNGASAVVSSLCITPFEIFRVRFMLEEKTTSLGLFTSMTKSIYKMNGLSGFYRGVGMTLMRDVPFYMVFFGTYQYFMSTLRTEPSTLNYIMYGGTAGSISWFLVYPFDKIKSIQQSEVRNKYESLNQLLRENKCYNLRYLYKGVAPCVIRGFPANAALFFGIEQTKNALHKLGFDGAASLGHQRQ